MAQTTFPASPVIAAVLCCAVGAAAATGAEARKKDYNVPGGDAATTLAQFARHSGNQIIYMVENVRGENTRPVHGEFTAIDALRQMLTGTGLFAVQDEATGALVVSRRRRSQEPGRPGPKALQGEPPRALPVTDPPEESTASSTQSPSPPPMKTRRFLPLLASWLLAASATPAQSVDPLAPGRNAADEAVVLNPFIVNTARDTGYAGSSTLAGTRLNTPVADLGASLSIFTKDFLDDIGATSANDLLIYATGMEAGGAGGNFSGAAGSNIANANVFSDAARNEPQSVLRTRGLASPNLTRGFFTTDIAQDAYIVDSITVNRGPNAALFGVGSAAGVVESDVLRADLNRNLNKVQLRYGNNDSLRTNVDFSRVLVPKKLALRIAALDDEDRPQQRPAFETKRRVYGALNFEPFKTTSFRANFEAGRTTANRPFTGLPLNSISQEWYATGMPAFDWTWYDDPSRNPNAAAMNPNSTNAPIYVRQGFMSRTYGQAAFTGGLIQVYDNFNAAKPSIGFPSLGPATTTTYAANAIRNNVYDPVFNRDTAQDAIWLSETLNVAEIAAAYYPDGLKPAGIKYQGFANYNAFDWRNRQIDETGRQGDSFNTFTLNFEQRAWADRVGLALAYYNQEYRQWNRNPFFSTGGGANHVRIDVNVSLPNGQPNPNLGRPYATFQQTANGNGVRERRTGRATAYLRYDFKERSPTWGKWLGRHALTGVGEQSEAEILSFSTRLAAVAGENGVPSADFGSQPILVVYLGPSVLKGAPLQLNPIQIPRPVDGFTSYTATPVAAAGDTRQAVYGLTQNVFREISNGASASREVIKSTAAVFHSYWLDDLLVTTLGWRRDEDFTSRAQLLANATAKLRWGVDDFNFPTTPPLTAARETKSASAVLRWPHRFVKLPRGMNASVFFNNSGNFTPLGTRVNFNNEPLSSPEGLTREIGLNLSFLNEKLSFRYNRFETSVKGQTLSGGPLSTTFNNSILQTITLWTQDQNKPGNTIDRRPAINALLEPIPKYRQLIGFTMSGTGATDDPLKVSWTPLAGMADTTDIVAKGHELEAVWNPSRRLRLLANFTRQEASQSNIAPVTRELLRLMEPVWRSPLVGNTIRGVDTTLNYITSQTLIPYANLIATEGTSTAEIRKYRANLVANYTFAPEGRLKGFNLGGGFRWQDKIAIGYPTTRNPDTSVKIDLTHPYFGPAESNLDAFAGYTRRLWKNSIEWRVQLNVRNVIGSGALIPINAQPDGSVAAYRLPPERRWYITNSFSF